MRYLESGTQLWLTETADLSNTEQMVSCIRYVDSELEVHEEIIGMYNLESTDACSIMSAIQDILLRIKLNIGNCRGQCYDGEASLLGARSGVATKLLELEPRALYTHCYGHALNLAVQDSLK